MEGVPCDIVCTGRFHDFAEKRAHRWGLVLRQPIYEKDRMDAVTPGALPVLDEALLRSYPEGYRHWHTRSGGSARRSSPTCRA